MWECFHASAVEAVSQSQVAELMRDRSSSPTGRASRCGRSPCSRGSWPARAWPSRPTHSRPVARADEQQAPEQREPAVELDHAADVARVAVAEVVEDLVVDRVELLADRLDLLGGQAAGAGSPISVGMRSSSEFEYLDGPLGGVDAGTDHLAALARHLAGAQVADLARLSSPTQVWQMPIAAAERQASARRPRRPRGSACCRPSAPRTSLLRKRIVPPSPALGVVAADERLEALHVQAVAVAVRVPVLVDRVEQLGRAGDERLALAPVGAEPRRGRRA